MINYLSGLVRAIDTQIITLEVNGFGFAVSVPDEKLFSIDQEVKLEIYFYWNQENGPQLFGFKSKSEKDIFSLIIGCSGVGPKLALSILSQISIQDFLQAITLADVKALSSLSGIGTKKAELLIMQLKDKVNKNILNLAPDKKNTAIIKFKEITDVLNSLNYSKQEISMALDYIKKEFGSSNLAFDELLRKALSYLVKIR